MSTFLNRPLIVEKIANIIEEANKEIIFIVPYIKLSDSIYEKLKTADKRGVQISLIYRENKLTTIEKQKLSDLDNLNLLFHAEIHAKCYFNETEMVITSMNLYEYSEKYNREMGILISNSPFGDTQEYKDALNEVRDIIKTASLEKKSKRTLVQGFTSDLLKPKYERLFNSCKLVNRYFDNKRFEVVDDGNNGVIKCSDYYENIHVFIEPDYSEEINTETGHFKIHRVSLDFNWEEGKRRDVNTSFWSPATEFMFEGYKVYWDYFSKNLTIYRDKWHSPDWNTFGFEETISRFKQGIESVSSFIRSLERQLR